MEAVEYAKIRKPFGKALASNQAIQFPLVELQTQCEMLRALIHKTAWQMDTYGAFSVSDKIYMCNFVANRLCCDAADQAMQVFADALPRFLRKFLPASGRLDVGRHLDQLSLVDAVVPDLDRAHL